MKATMAQGVELLGLMQRGNISREAVNWFIAKGKELKLEHHMEWVLDVPKTPLLELYHSIPRGVFKWVSGNSAPWLTEGEDGLPRYMLPASWEKSPDLSAGKRMSFRFLKHTEVDGYEKKVNLEDPFDTFNSEAVMQDMYGSGWRPASIRDALTFVRKHGDVLSRFKTIGVLGCTECSPERPCEYFVINQQKDGTRISFDRLWSIDIDSGGYKGDEVFYLMVKSA